MDNSSRKKLRPRKKRLQIDTITAETSVSTASAVIDTEESKQSKQNVSDKEQETTSSSGAAAETEPVSPARSGNSSPDPNCAICLGKLENKSFTDSCFHQFCFVCLVEWSKVKAECPLCKQSFKSIVHNVRSYDDYDQYHIPRPEDRNPMQEFAAPSGARFRYRTTVTDHRYAHLASRIGREIENRLLQRPSIRNPMTAWRRIRQPANSEFRRGVYNQHLKLIVEQMNTRRRVRETSPAFFRENQAQTHRLVPWLNRELNALLQGHGSQVAFVMDLIMGLIKRFAIDSEEFYQHVFPFTGRHTRQFMHEFLMFAKSPYHMAAYDRHITYEPGDVPNHDSESDSDHQIAMADDGNDSDVIVVSPSNSPPSEVRNNPTAAPQRLLPLDPNLVPWERNVLTAGNPSYLGFAPIVRCLGTDDLSLRLDQNLMRNSFQRPEPPLSASGWDSPTPGPSSFFGGGSATIDHFTTSNHGLSQSISISQGTNSSIWTPSSTSISAPSTPLLPSAPNPYDNNFLFDILNMVPSRLPQNQQVTVPSTSLGNPIICNASDTDSNASDLMIVDYEKPWTERSPIKLSSGEESDVDVMITKTEYANDCIKTEKKKKKKHRHKHDGTKLAEKRSRDEFCLNRPSKKSRRSRSRSVTPSHKSRSRSRSPLQNNIYRSPDYKHKKFSYSSHTGSTDRHDSRHYPRSHSNGRSLHRARSWGHSISSSDSEPENESRHVSIRSHKHKSKHSSIQIVEYRKKSSRYKKNKKHRKDKADEERSSSKDMHSKKYKRDKERYDDHRLSKSGHSSLNSHSKHLGSKPKKKKSKHRKDKHIAERPENVHAVDLPQNLSGDLVTQKTALNTDSSETDLDVSKQMSIIMKEIEEIEKQKTHEISGTVTTDSDPDSNTDIDVEQLSGEERENKRLNSYTESKNTRNSENINKTMQADGNDETRTEQHISKTNHIDLSELDTKDTAAGQKAVFNPSGFNTANIEFVELSSVQASAFDEDLESLTQSLSGPRYDSSFLTSDFIKPKPFKKHPHGHKKSCKSTNASMSMPVSSANALSLIESETTTPDQKFGYHVTPDIQSNDISSCTDLDTELKLPSFLSFVDQNQGYNSLMKQLENNSKQHNHLNTSGTSENSNETNDFDKDIPQGPLILPTEYELPSSSECPSSSGNSNMKNNSKTRIKDYVNVETVSSGESDIDITGVENSKNYLAMTSYITSKDSIKFTKPDECIDVVGVSDDDEDNDDCNVTFSVIPSCSGINKRNDYGQIDVSDSDSNSTVQYVGVEHGNIDITGESDSESSDKNMRVNHGNIDITGESDSESSVKDMRVNHGNIDIAGESDSESSDKDMRVNHGNIDITGESDSESSVKNMRVNHGNIDITGESDSKSSDKDMRVNHGNIDITGESDSESSDKDMRVNHGNIDITGESDSESSVKDMRVNHGNIDITGESDSESSDKDMRVNHGNIDITGESDSDSSNEHFRVKHGKINITGESKDDDCHDKEVDFLTDDGDSDIDITGDDVVDVIGHSGDEIVIDVPGDEENGSLNEISIYPESESTDLDYQCDEYVFSENQCLGPKIDLISPTFEDAIGNDKVPGEKTLSVRDNVNNDNDLSEEHYTNEADNFLSAENVDKDVPIDNDTIQNFGENEAHQIISLEADTHSSFSQSIDSDDKKVLTVNHQRIDRASLEGDTSFSEMIISGNENEASQEEPDINQYGTVEDNTFEPKSKIGNETTVDKVKTNTDIDIENDMSSTSGGDIVNKVFAMNDNMNNLESVNAVVSNNADDTNGAKYYGNTNEKIEGEETSTKLSSDFQIENNNNTSAENELANISSPSTSSQPDNSSFSGSIETPRLAWLFNPLFEPRSPSYIHHSINDSGTMSNSSPGSSPRSRSPQYMATVYEPQSPTYPLSLRSPIYPPTTPPDLDDIFTENFAPED